MTRQGAWGYSTISAMEHHVYFWLKEEQKTAENRAAFEEGLRSLLRIDGVERGLWGRPAAVMPRPVIDDTWDYSLSMTFASVETQDAYQVDPTHLVFIAENKDRWARALVMDVEPCC
jgi:hypothetical protein